MTPPSSTGRAMEALEALMAHLRSPQGCPWDRAQSFRSLLPYTIEETYEVVEAVERGESDALMEELGDLLFHVVFYSRIAQEEEKFTLEEVTRRVTDKMVRRHPHVFGETPVHTPDQVVDRWEEAKQNEEKSPKNVDSVFDGLTSKMPALMYAFKIQQKMAKVGFDWSHLGGVLDQLRREMAELDEAHLQGSREEVEGELGDLLFSVVNLARHLKINPETALRTSTLKCRNRFQEMEKRLAQEGMTPRQADADHLELLWSESKKRFP